jgi:serpin B
LVVLLVAGACGTSAATQTLPAGTPGAASPLNSVAPTAAAVEPTPSIATPTAYLTQDPSGRFTIVLGRAPLLAPAADNGNLAGTEVNDFGFDLLRRLDSKGNLCASPASIALALAMVRPGARGATAAEMDKVMHDFGATGQAAEIVSLIGALQSATSYDATDPQATPGPSGPQPVVELDVSNAVFAQKGMSLQPAYLDSLSSGFGAGLGLLDYIKDPDGARQVINQWASDRTKGRIPAVLQPGDVDALTRIALANAIYLKAGWSFPFDPSETHQRQFTRADGSTASVPTMAMDRLLNYSAGSGYRAVTLPFTGSGALAMTIVVPDDMASFVGGLTASKLAAIELQGTRYDVDLTLPRFSVETRTDLATTLAAMGMPTLFEEGGADLSGITTDEQLFIAKVIHQANIDVVEQGTTAAAVTVAVGRATTGGGESLPQPVQFHVDRPFLYFIQEQSTGAVLFMGRVADPSAKS